MKLRAACVVLGFLSLAQLTFAQSTAETASALPRLVRFSGTVKDLNGNSLTGVLGITFALYSEQTGGGALWLETQNVTADSNGRYVALLGSTKPDGLPTELFIAEQARWVGVQVSGQAEQPRVLLLSVPYALKAADAETLGGKPASAYLLSPQPREGAPASAQSNSAAASKPVSNTDKSAMSATVSGGGTTNYIPRWTSSSNLGNSIIFQSATNVGIGTTSPTQKFQVSSGDVLAKGVNNFKSQGDVAHIYAGDKNHSMTATFNTGLSLDTYLVPNSIFIQDRTGWVGMGTTSPTNAMLTTVANLGSVVGLSTLGWNAPLNSNANGYDAIHATGGNGDGNNFKNGGIGLVSTGGVGDGAGAGVVANGGLGGNGGGAGVIANGGGAGNDGAGGGAGVIAQGGNGETGGGVGGVFTAGVGGKAGNADGIDVSTQGTFGSAGYFAGGFYAGEFIGDLYVTGTIFAGTKDFKIDHPLDPANKYLLHASVESSEMKNIYDGMVVLDANGEAVVQLPAWFEAVNGSFRYQLTAIGHPSPGLYVAQEISGSRFHIAGGAPGSKVSWQVTGVRQDAYARANPLVVEQEKSVRERGYYIHPELYGAPEEMGVEWMRHYKVMRDLKQRRMTRSVPKAALSLPSLPSTRLTGAQRPSIPMVH